MEQRSLLLFQNTIKTEETLKKYLYYLNRFKNHYKLKDFDSMITKLDKDQLQIMIEDYVMYLKRNGASKSSVAGPIGALCAFLDINDVEIRWMKIRRLFPAQGKRSGKRAWRTQQIQTMLSFAISNRSKALIHFLASSGVRIGSLPDMKIGDVKGMPSGCKSICVYANDKEEYYTFLTPEAATALDNYHQQRKDDGEYLDNNSPLFRQEYQIGTQPVHKIHRDTLAMILYRILRRSKMRTENNGKRKETQIAHGFRKRFNTILKSKDGANADLIEKMMGHSTTIPLDDAYLDASIEKLFQEFKKGIPELTIDGMARKQAELEQKEKENSVLQKQVNENKEIKLQIARLEAAVGIKP